MLQDLDTVLDAVAANASVRVRPSLQDARDWQTATMNGLDVPDPLYVGRFRGEPGLENVDVEVGAYPGTPASDVAHELSIFETRVHAAVAELDGRYPDFDSLVEDGLKAVIEVCACAHGPAADTVPPARRRCSVITRRPNTCFAKCSTRSSPAFEHTGRAI